MPSRSRRIPVNTERRRPSAARRVTARVQAPRAHVSEVQRARMLACAARVIAEHGYEQMSVARIAHGARVSRRTFYDLFEDREDCFLAVFDDALARVSGRVLDAYNGAGEHDRDWRERVRAGLQALLWLFDEEPQVSSLLIVNALRGGPRVLERRAEALARVSEAIQRSGSRASHTDRESPAPLSGEGVVGGVLAVIHTRLSAKHPKPLLGLLNPLMAVIVLPYLGPAAAQRELRGIGTFSSGRKQPAGLKSPTRLADISEGDPLADLPMRLTYRTLRVLEAIADRPGASNRAVADLAGITDQGQVSKLLARLEGLGLIGTAGQRRRPTGEPNAWRLTPLGERVTQQLSLSTPLQEDAA